jgi:RNA-directed DNA polymerase
MKKSDSWRHTVTNLSIDVDQYNYQMYRFHTGGDITNGVPCPERKRLVVAAQASDEFLHQSDADKHLADGRLSMADPKPDGNSCCTEPIRLFEGSYSPTDDPTGTTQTPSHGHVPASAGGVIPARVVSPLDLSGVSLQRIATHANLQDAADRFKRNGLHKSPGPDGICGKASLRKFIQSIPEVRQQFLDGTIEFDPAKLCLIDKRTGGWRPLHVSNGKTRKKCLAILNQIERVVDHQFSENSFGFRPGRSGIDAMRHLQSLVKAGREYIVILDLHKYFENIDHFVLLGDLASNGMAPEVIQLLRKVVTAGTVERIRGQRVHTPATRGVPQGSPVGPILSNMYLHPSDKEWKTRDLPFSRFADDMAFAVRSKRAGKRVKSRATRYLKDRLNIEVNKDKTKILHFSKVEFLSYTFSSDVKIRIPGRVVDQLVSHAQRIRLDGNAERARRHFNRRVLSRLPYYKHVEVPMQVTSLVGRIAEDLIPEGSTPAELAVWTPYVQELRRRIARYPHGVWGSAVNCIDEILNQRSENHD